MRYVLGIARCALALRGAKARKVHAHIAKGAYLATKTQGGAMIFRFRLLALLCLAALYFQQSQASAQMIYDLSSGEPQLVLDSMCGSTSLIQSTWGKDGNFEVVVPYPTGGLAHYWRDNDDLAQTWHGPTVFGVSAGFVNEVSLIESNFFGGGNFEVVARVGDMLFHFWRDLDNNWHESGPFASGVSGAPALIQSRFGKVGNFEVVAPLATGSMAHFWRDNDDPLLRWYGPTSFGQGQGPSGCCELEPGQPLERATSGCVGECSDFFSDTFAIGSSGGKCVCQRGSCRLFIAMDGELCPNQTAHIKIERNSNMIWSQDFTFGDSSPSLVPPSLVPIYIPAASGDSLMVHVSFGPNGSSVSCKRLGNFNFSVFF